MNWIRANYDRAAVLAGALFLLLCTIFIFLASSNFDERFSGLENMPRSNKKTAAGRGEELAVAMKRLQTPPQWTVSSRAGLFVPEKHFIDASGRPATLKNTVLHPPVPNEWLEEFGLPITDSDVLTQDSDGDGFNNVEEWQGHSSPTEKDSHPPYTALLTLKSFTKQQFPLIFSSSVGDTFAINNLDRRIPTQFLKVGDTIAGTKFKITGYTEKYDTDQFGTRIDVSELTLEHAENHDKVTLVKEKTTTSPESVANFVYAWGGKSENFSVKKDHEFSLKPKNEIKYKLLDVQANKAIIANTQQPNEKIEIPLLQP